MKLYTHTHLRKNECKALIIFALILIISAIIAVLIGVWYVAKDKSLDWYCVVGGIICLLSLFWILDIACRFCGDKIVNGKIIYYKFFKKYIIDISKIKVIVISARWGGHWGTAGTMRKNSNTKESMPCISILKTINEYKAQYFYMHNIKDFERKDFLYSFNATDNVLVEFFKNEFYGKIYILDRIYNENKEFFETLRNSLNIEQMIIYEANLPDNEIFY